MPRARNLKPGFFKNEELAGLGPWAMLLFAGLWTLADRDGRLEDRPPRIRAEIFPYAPRTNVVGLLNYLEEKKFIVRYSASGSKYIQIVNFNKHQSPHKDEAKSTIPAPCERRTEHGSSTLEKPLTPDCLNLNPDCLDSHTPTRVIDADFLEVAVSVAQPEDKAWEEYIVIMAKGGKKFSSYDLGVGLKQWLSLSPNDQQAAIVHATEICLKTADPQFIPFPVNHLKQKQWTRAGPGRLMEEPRMESKSERGQRLATEKFLRSKGVVNGA